MKHERRDQLRDLYGVDFPDDLFEFWDWYQHLEPAMVRSFHDELGMRLAGPFDVLSGRFDEVDLRYPTVLHWRYQFDPPEFFTVLSGDTDGLHWGYWYDDPEHLPPCAAAWYASDAFELWTAGRTLFDAVRERTDGVASSLKEYMADDPDNVDEYRNSLENLASLNRLLPAARSSEQRVPTHMTPEGMGVVLPVDAGEAGKMLLRGKQLWFDGDPEAFNTLERAYTKLNRAPLAAIVRTHQKHPRLPSVDILQYRIGDYHSFEEALAEPTQVLRLEIGGAKLNELPNLSSVTELRELSLWGNALSELPGSLKKCGKLESINLHRNEFETVPAVLFELPKLRVLKLSGNKLTSIGESLNRWQQLDELLLIGNPIPATDHDSIRSALPDTAVSF